MMKDLSLQGYSRKRFFPVTFFLGWEEMMMMKRGTMKRMSKKDHVVASPKINFEECGSEIEFPNAHIP